jgi:hypothetical protein
MHRYRSLSALLVFAMATTASAFDDTYKKFGEVLAKHVRDGVVDYRGIQEQSMPTLEAAIAEIAAVDEATFGGWSREAKMAYLINAYNAFTLQLVADFYPVKSIRDIGGKVGGGLFGRQSKQWKVAQYEVGGKVRAFKAMGRAVTLDEIEHDWLRPKFEDPRIHFALVCGAKSCPFLRSEPYVAARLGEQLDAQGRQFLADSYRNRYDAKKDTLYLSKIFDWFGKDFTRRGSLVSFLKPFFPKEWNTGATEASKIEFLDYDWSLNDTPAKG